jgi:hypothetical protein
VKAANTSRKSPGSLLQQRGQPGDVVEIISVNGQDVPAEGPGQATDVPGAPVALALLAPGGRRQQGQVEGVDKDGALKRACLCGKIIGRS